MSAVIGRLRANARAEHRVLVETPRAREAAETATALTSRLIEVVSHDLKNSLLGIMMTADIIRGASTNQELVGKRASAVKQESQQMFELVQDMLDYSAAAMERIDLNCLPLNLARLFAERLNGWRIRAGRKEKIFESWSNEKMIEGMAGDGAHLRQVAENLVGNAMKFSPRGSEIIVCVERGGLDTVAGPDPGPGLREADFEPRFRPHRKLRAVPTGSESSAGLGRALVHSLVRRHGGSLRASNSPDGHAVLMAEFPRRQPT